MAFCTNCGNPIPDGANFCTSCGTSFQNEVVQPEPEKEPIPKVEEPVEQPIVEQVPPTPIYSAPTPQYAQNPQVAPTTPYMEEPISVKGFLGLLCLMLIPIVNIILIIVWAFGGHKKRTVVNYVRASLLFSLILTVFIVILAICFPEFIESLDELFNT